MAMFITEYHEMPFVMTNDAGIPMKMKSATIASTILARVAV